MALARFMPYFDGPTRCGVVLGEELPVFSGRNDDVCGSYHEGDRDLMFGQLGGE